VLLPDHWPDDEVVFARPQALPDDIPLLRRSGLAERMNAARAEGKRLAELSLHERQGQPLARFGIK
jgi:hypothetical protein